MDLLARVARTIAEHDLLPDGSRVVVAVSGGADSLTLLDLLLQLRGAHDWELVAAVFDHAWRAESADEAAAVAAYVRSRGLQCVVARASEARRDEAGAREQRHAFLAGVADPLGPETRIALGHNQDDRVQTLLLNLVRGCGTTGLGAMPYRSGRLVRPLLDCDPAEVRAYAAARSLPVVEDPSNRDQRYRRNQLEDRLLRSLEEFQPGAAAALARSSGICAEERQALQRYGHSLYQRRLAALPERAFLGGLDVVALDLTDWADEARPERHLILRELLRAARGHLTDAGSRAIGSLDALALGRPDAEPLRLPSAFGDAVAVRFGHHLLFGVLPAWPAWPERALARDAPTELPETGLRLLLGEDARPCYLQTLVSPGGSYHVRRRRDGDTLRPAGRGGSRKVSDLLLEYGVPRLARDRVPLLVAGEQVAWLPGGPADERFADPHGLRVGIEFTVVS